ncbi:MAG: hypothetical protein AAF558_12965, partial [Verrucomicrobiota bacterium]
MSQGAQSERQKSTYFYERWRAGGGSGILETFSGTFFLLIAIEYFQASTALQSVIAAAHAVGLLLSPVVIYAARYLEMQVSRLTAILHLVGAAALIPFLLEPFLFGYLLGGMLISFVVTGTIPLLTQVYQQNYPSAKRGALFGSSNRIKVIVAAVFAAAVGKALSDEMSQVPGYMFILFLSLLFSAYCLFRMPSEPLEPEPGYYPYKSLGLLWQNRDFLWLIIVWMFMGFGNLMMVPLRVIVLVDSKYGFEYTPGIVALLTAVIPQVVIFLFNGMWGKLFDRINFFLLRFILNCLFALSILT